MWAWRRAGLLSHISYSRCGYFNVARQCTLELLRAALFCRAPVWLLPVKIQTAQNSRVPNQEAVPGRKFPSFCLSCDSAVQCSLLSASPALHWISGYWGYEIPTLFLQLPHLKTNAGCSILPVWLPVFRVGGMITLTTHTSLHQFSCTTGKPHTLLEIKLFNISLTEWIKRISSSLFCTNAVQGRLFG